MAHQEVFLRILVAEGQESLRRLIVSCLEERKYFVLQTAECEGIEHLLKQNVELLLLDAALIKEKTKAYLSHLRNSYPDLPVVVMSSHETANESLEILSQGAVDCLIKPFTVEKLEASLEKAFPREIPREGQTKRSDEEFEGKGYINLDSLPSVQRHPLMKKAIGLIRNVAESDITVLLSGESGVGKEIFARTLHQRSNRRLHRFVGLNCASVPESLLEAELFGCERGSYTGSVGQRIGKFELAQKGTLLLDEVSEMDVVLQSKLLRVIQEKEMYRVGGDRPVRLDVRIVSTTNRDLYDWVKKGNFREDLFYRLNVIAMEIPPLRERVEDIPILSQYIVDRINRDYKDSKFTLAMDAVEQLCQYQWPGNIRELENVLIRSVFMSTGKSVVKIQFDEKGRTPAPLMAPAQGKIMTLEEVERNMIRQALEQHTGNRTHAANALGISVRTLRNKLQLYRELEQSSPDPEKTTVN